VSDIYFDAVLDENYTPVFNGTPGQTAVWLLENSPDYNDLYRVCRGKDMKMFAVAEYLEMRGYKEVPEPTGTKQCPDCNDLILDRDMKRHQEKCLRTFDGTCRKCKEPVSVGSRWQHWASCGA
jgi:hypothetical protein